MAASQPRFDDALEIAVCDLPPPAEVEREATITLLPYSSKFAGVPANSQVLTHADGDDEWLDEDDVLLEASDVIAVEAVRAVVYGDSEASSEGFAFSFEDDDDNDDQFADATDTFPIDPSAETLLDRAAEAASDAGVTARPLANTDLARYESSVDIEIVESDASEPEPDEPEVIAKQALLDPIRVPLWSGLNSFGYGLSRGLRGMGQSPLVQLLAVATMAVCMLLLGTTMLILQNAQRVVHDLGVDTPVTVYMQPEVDADTLAQLHARIAELPEVATVEHVTPEIALTRLQDGLGGGDSIESVGAQQRAELLAGIDASTLPDSLEIGLIAGVEPGFADALAERITGMPGVEEVSALGPWVQEVESMLATLRWLAFGIGVLVSLACLAIVWNTIRLGVFARRSEIEILRLVGGTKRFVRGPFVVEGVVQGVLGTALAIAGLWLGFELIRPFLERGMALMFAAGSLKFFTMIELGVALGFGAVIGLIGSRAAVARHA